MPDKKNNKAKDREKKETPLKPDPETLHTTEPQENMEGPVSSLMHNTGKGVETNKSRE